MITGTLKVRTTATGTQAIYIPEEITDLEAMNTRTARKHQQARDQQRKRQAWQQAMRQAEAEARRQKRAEAEAAAGRTFRDCLILTAVICVAVLGETVGLMHPAMSWTILAGGTLGMICRLVWWAARR